MILPFIILLAPQMVAVDFFSFLQRVATATRPRASCAQNAHSGVPVLAAIVFDMSKPSQAIWSPYVNDPGVCSVRVQRNASLPWRVRLP
jgi:hypothetical protein